MTEFYWILGSGLLMSVIALSGSLTLVLPPALLERLLLPLVGLSAGSLLGGAFFHLLPAALGDASGVRETFAVVLLGFTLFFLLEQFFHWHRCRTGRRAETRPLTWLILIGDGLHNFLGGLAIAGTFLVDIRLGITSWVAAALHEVPQELGDFGVLVHGGWSKRRALLFNFASGLTFLAGGLLTFALATAVDVSLLIPFAAGNFLYIAAADLIPEVNREAESRINLSSVAAFLAGLALLWLVQFVEG